MVRSKNQALLDFVEEALVLGCRTGEITFLVEDSERLETVTERTISRYITAIRERWATEELELRPQRRQELRRRAEMTFRKAYTEGGKSLGTAATCLKILQEMDGLKAPQKIEVNGQINVKAMSPDQRRTRVAELWAIRQKAIAEGRVIDVLPSAPKRKKLPAPKKAAKKIPAKRKKTAGKKTKATIKKAPARARKKKSK